MHPSHQNIHFYKTVLLSCYNQASYNQPYYLEVSQLNLLLFSHQLHFLQQHLPNNNHRYHLCPHLPFHLHLHLHLYLYPHLHQSSPLLSSYPHQLHQSVYLQYHHCHPSVLLTYQHKDSLALSTHSVHPDSHSYHRP